MPMRIKMVSLSVLYLGLIGCSRDLPVTVDDIEHSSSGSPFDVQGQVAQAMTGDWVFYVEGRYDGQPFNEELPVADVK